MKTTSRWTLDRYQLLGVLLYSATFAVLNSVGGAWTEVSLLGWAPFLPAAYVTGSVGASVQEGQWGFLVGAAVGIAVQTWACCACGLRGVAGERKHEIQQRVEAAMRETRAPLTQPFGRYLGNVQ